MNQESASIPQAGTDTAPVSVSPPVAATAVGPRRIVGAMASVRPAATILHAWCQHSGRRAIVAMFGPGHVLVAPKSWCRSAVEFRRRCHERTKHSSWCKLMRRTRSSCDFDSPNSYPLMPIRKNALSQAPCARSQALRNNVVHVRLPRSPSCCSPTNLDAFKYHECRNEVQPAATGECGRVRTSESSRNTPPSCSRRGMCKRSMF